MMKYRLQKKNMVQETNSAERRDELLARGYALKSVDGKPAVAGVEDAAVPEAAHTELMQRYAGLENENRLLKEQIEAMTRQEAEPEPASKKEEAPPQKNEAPPQKNGAEKKAAAAGAKK